MKLRTLAVGLMASALALTAWTEKWVPDAFIFALIGTLIVTLLLATIVSYGVSRTMTRPLSGIRSQTVVHDL